MRSMYAGQHPDLYVVDLRLILAPYGAATDAEAFAALSQIVGRDIQSNRLLMDANQLCRLMLAQKAPCRFPGPLVILDDRPLDRWQIVGWEPVGDRGGGPSQELADWVVAVTEGAVARPVADDAGGS